VLGARRLDRLQALAGELGLGTDAAMQTDVTDREQVKALVDRAVTMHGHLDVIVNNAGLMPHSPLERGKVDDWDRMIDVNLKGVLYGIAAALPHVTGRKVGTSSTYRRSPATRSARAAPSMRPPDPKRRAVSFENRRLQQLLYGHGELLS
jgi:NADP-dependent 3-hydroxy acid dehydrogenase YdfG